MADSTEDGRALKMLTFIDESTKEILVIEVFRQIKSINIIKVLDELFIRKGHSEHIRSDNGRNGLGFRLNILNSDVLGKTDTMNPSMENIEMSY